MALCRNFVVPALLQRHQQLARMCSGRNEGNADGKACRDDFGKAAANAYEVLGLSESCSEASIRETFRKLAKATHPDLQADTSTAQFIRILAAYEILSDPLKRSEYNKHLKSRRAQSNSTNVSQTTERPGYDNCGFEGTEFHEEECGSSPEVVSWLRSYRAMIKEVVNRREIGAGKGWEEELRAEVQSALQRAYFGPPVSAQQGLPECFEAEERSQPELEDVLHLVSGRQLFGVVRQVRQPRLERQKDVPFLVESNSLDSQHDCRTPDPDDSRTVSTSDGASVFIKRHASFASKDGPEVSHHSGAEEATSFARKDGPEVSNHSTVEETTCVDLELELFGNVVARAIRVPFKADTMPGSDRQHEHDCIYIYLSAEQVEDTSEFVNGTLADDSKFSKILLGTIHSLSSAGLGNSCFAHDPDGKRTHLILQHTTPLVKHMQWFRLGQGSAACECRCRRASTIPSRYWIFEPRTDTHNVGGWYIETFKHSRTHKGANLQKGPPMATRTAPVGSDMPDLLHPAMYIMAAAYKTLDEEHIAAAKREASLPRKIKYVVNASKFTSALARWWKQK